MRFGAKRKTFSRGCSRTADRDLFFEGVRLDGVAEPLPLGDSSRSSARAAFCRRVRALIVTLRMGEMSRKGIGDREGTSQIGGSR